MFPTKLKVKYAPAKEIKKRMRIKIENKEVMVVHILHVLNNYKYKTCQVKQLPQTAKIKLRIYIALHNSH